MASQAENTEDVMQESVENLNVSNREEEQKTSTTDDDLLSSLMRYFGKHVYEACHKDDMAKNTLQNCMDLFKRDYNLSIIDNSEGVLCPSYPSLIPVPISEAGFNRNTNLPNDSSAIRKFMENCNTTRCRYRFVVPVMLLRGRFICRSATLSGSLELFGRKSMETVGTFFRDYEFFLYDTDAIAYSDEDKEAVPSQSLIDKISTAGDAMVTTARQNDITWLKILKVDTIVDLMVEKKKVKYGLYVSSSEKVDSKNRYKDFNLIGIPYPGCEFFAEFRSHSHDASNLHYNWEQAFNNATLNIIDNAATQQLEIEWTDYQKWNLIDITSHYMKYLLNYFAGAEGGMVVHCISGWDRTPLFISLLRLSLWADGLVHTSLNAYEIAYFTVAYDWFCFGHQLPSRLNRTEDVFLFCFYMLKYMTGPEFSLIPRFETDNKSDTRINCRVNRPSTNSNHSDEGLQFQDMQTKNRTNSASNSNRDDASSDSIEVLSQKSEGSNDTFHSQHSQPSQAIDLQVPKVGGTPESSPRSVGSVTSPRKLRITSPINIPPQRLSGDNDSTSGFCHVGQTGSLHSRGDPSEIGNVSDEENRMQLINRANRLNEVRRIFYQTYFKTIGSSNIQYGAQQQLSMLGMVFGAASSVASAATSAASSPSAAN